MQGRRGLFAWVQQQSFELQWNDSIDVEEAVDNHLFVVETQCTSSSASQEYLDLLDNLPDHCKVQERSKCVTDRSPLFIITLLIGSGSGNNGDFGLLCSMSHVIGDGRTSYDIYNMLSEDSDIVPLDYVRKSRECAYLEGLKATGIEASSITSSFFDRFCLFYGLFCWNGF